MNSFSGHHYRVLCLSLSGGLLASGAYGKIIIHNTEDGNIVKEVAAHSDYIRTVEFSTDGLMLASGSYDKTCKVWDTRTWELLKEIPHPDGVAKVRFAEDNKLVTGCWDNVIRTFGTDFNEIVAEGGIAGRYVVLHKDFKAVADGIVVKVYDNENIMQWQQPRNYALNLKNAKIDGADLSDMNRQIWQQHNEKLIEEKK